jgi:RimJ/RimL family protein N-acetyltransferase
MNRAVTIARLGRVDGRLTYLKPIPTVSADELFGAVAESRIELERFMPFATDSESVADFVTRTRANHEAGIALELAIFEKASGKLSGVLGLNRFDPFTPKANLGYWIRTSMTGHGLATDAVQEAIRLSREQLQLGRIDAAVAVDNLPSQRVLLKSGFVEEGLKKHSQLCHGQWQDMLLFGRVL